ncbi:penicillin-binding protein 2 [Verrucomicrobium sp. GAS474]|uniref:penicillin-binding protein 2 n=1 Tax=Verrucomicrobium sp. GAS474 TaxID=1882831 RepID=UPI00087AEA9B|nr:penicillin-binding protein 2 [Verrucomicrobium sp. GAS474]SDU24394.1 penicillin-binding protein 2 [Verrucomicrobium sp. GAS474]
MLFEPMAYARTRFVVVGGCFILGACVLLVRLWNIEVAEGKTYAGQQRDQTTVNVRLSPARGAIVDRNGVAFAENRASFDIDFYLDELVRNYRREHKNRLPMVTVPKRSGGTRQRIDIVKIVTTYLEPISLNLGFAIKLDEKAINRHYETTPTIPFQYRSDVDFATLAKFSERSLGVPGIQIAVRPVRSYNYGAMAPHILGYVGVPDEKDVAALEDGELIPEEVGRHGLEKAFDGQLQGKPGARVLQVDHRGYINKVEDEIPPTIGNSLRLTIDARMQYIVEQVLRRQGRASAVVMDPWNGDILAMASVPSYDPNDFIPRISSDKWKNLIGDPTAPLLNRALSTYVPGSTFKVVVSLAAMKAGKLTPNTTINCPSAIWIGNRLFHNDDKADRPAVDVKESLRLSINTFYYQLGIRIGINTIKDFAEELGLGLPTELPLPEDKGLIPTPAWLKQVHPLDHWSDARTANVSIGQGEVGVSPVQMAVVMSAVANGGTVYYPRLIEGVNAFDGSEVVSVPTRVRGTIDAGKENLDAVREGLRQVVDSGTATLVQLPYWKVAGKTGTAQAFRRVDGQTMRDLRTWFYCYAPYEKPRYVVCVLVEGGEWGGSTNGPLVHDILEGLHQLELGQVPDLVYLNPAAGNFSGMTSYTAPAMPSDGPVSGTAVPEDAADAPQSPPPENERFLPTSSKGPRGSKR